MTALFMMTAERHAQIVEALEDAYSGSILRFDETMAMLKAMQHVSCPPSECQTEAEKTAYAFGWWKALESVRAQPASPDLESRDFYELMQAYRHDPVDAAKSFEAVKAWLRNPTYEWGEQ